MSETQTPIIEWHGEGDYTVTEAVTIQTAAGQTLQVGSDGFVRGPGTARSKLFRLDPKRWGVLYLHSKWQGCEVELHLGDLLKMWGEFYEGGKTRMASAELGSWVRYIMGMDASLDDLPPAS